MRIFTLLFLAAATCIAAETTTTATPKAPKKAELTKSAKPTKFPGENRGKRTLNQFGVPGYPYNPYYESTRRQGYSNARAYYPYDQHYQSGPSYPTYSHESSNHLPEYSHQPHYPYPQYVEAPEPIIEIIIKDSNETSHSALPPQPIVHKKKKEKVHVYYVKYKKDKDNKLLLEEPIASLNNNDESGHDEEEEEEYIEYPAAVTPLPLPKPTTLRTIIHPESEKFHSNSGIHVSFGSEDKSQYGHQIQEHNAESVRQSVVALPPNKPVAAAAGHQKFPPAPSFFERFGAASQQYRSEFAQTRSSQPQYKPTAPPSAPKANYNQQYQQQQQPQYRPIQTFRPPTYYQNFQQQYQPQPQPQPQQPQYQISHRPIQTGPNYHTQQQPQQRPQQQPQRPQQQQQPQPRPQPTPQPTKESVFFPTPPPKTQEPPQKHPFQHTAFRPTVQPQNRPIPIPAQPQTHYQQHHQQPQQQHRPAQGQLQFQHQSHPVPEYNRPPQFGPAPSFQQQSYQPQRPQPQPQYRPQQQQQQQHHHAIGESSQGLGALHSIFNVKPSKETELLQSIPKYEQHITETINVNPTYQAHTQNIDYTQYNARNEAIKDIPAPQLGPTPPPTTQFSNFVTSPKPATTHQFTSPSTPAPQYAQSNDGQQIQIVTPMPSSQIYQNYQQEQYSPNGAQPQIILNSQPRPIGGAPSAYSVSTLHTDAFQELEQRKNSGQDFVNIQARNKVQPPPAVTSTTKRPQAALDLPDEVPEDLRQQLLSSGILDNADISVLDYDKVGDVALENLPQEHLQHFYSAGGGAQISESNKVLTVVKPNGDSVNFSEKELERVKDTQVLPRRQNVNLKVVRFDSANQKSVTDKFVRTDSTVLPSVDVADRQYNRYLPVKVNGAQFPIPDAEELRGKKISSVVVLAPVDTFQSSSVDEDKDGRQERDVIDSKQVRFAAGDSLKQLVKKPTTENYKKWLERESKTELDLQSVVLLVVKNDSDAQEIYMYDIGSGDVNKLNGELSSAFVNVAEENASTEDLENGSIYDGGIMEYPAEAQS